MVEFVTSIVKNLQAGSQQTACVINETETTYASFAANTGGIQKVIAKYGNNILGIVTQNHAATYAAIAATWATAKGYVPINPAYPVDRLGSVIEQAELTGILYAEDNEQVAALKEAFPHINFICTALLEAEELFNAHPQPHQTAYILFTSGTTGKPKGVPISFGNVEAFCEAFFKMGYELNSSDRFLQMFELTFDLSVMSFGIPLILGASFYTLPDGMIKTLALYQVLDDYKITFSLMVPSAIQLLKPYMDDVELPDLKYSQFCGEALKTELTRKWAQCVPNARIDNVYGPTEATIYCTALTLDKAISDNFGHNGIVKIGTAMSNMEARVFNENIPAQAGVQGELCLAGPQLTSGYLKNEEQNARSFFEYEGTRYYRTGDLCYTDDQGNLVYSGRKDDQIKIQGFRVELAELEHAASRVFPDKVTVAVAFQDKEQNWKLGLFVQNLAMDADKFGELLNVELPDYMRPHHIQNIGEIPLNSNGKTDRKTLVQKITAL